MNEIQDDGKRWNHSEEPNTSGENVGEGMDPESSYAKRDIKAGEEVRRGAVVGLRNPARGWVLRVRRGFPSMQPSPSTRS